MCITRGAFDVARFDEQGNAKAFRMWNGQTAWLHVLFLCIVVIKNGNLMEPKLRNYNCYV